MPRGKPVPRDIPREPRHLGEERFTVNESWPLPAVVVSYHITHDGHPDAYPLHILAKILSDGDSSRIYRSLVYEKQMALAAFGEAKLIEHPNLFYAVAIVQPGRRPDDVQKELLATLDRVKTEGVTAEELHRAKRQFARDYILGRETVQQKALHLGARGRHPRRHQDRGRRVRSVPERDAGRRAARREDVLHARVAHAADDPAARRRRRRRLPPVRAVEGPKVRA